MKIESKSYRKYRIVKKSDGYYNIYHPAEVDQWGCGKSLLEDGQAELEDIPSVEECKREIDIIIKEMDED